MTGTAGNDEFYATNTGTNARIDGAVLDGAAGTDKLYFQNTTAADGTPGKVSNIEQVYVQSTGGGGLVAANIAGAEQVWNNGSTANFSVLNIQNAVTLGAANSVNDMSVTFKASTFAAGSSLGVALDNAGTTADRAVFTVNQVAGAGTATDLTLAISASGSNAIQIADTPATQIGDFRTITVEGEGSVNLVAADDEFDGVRTFDASENSGGVNFTAGAFNATTNTITFTGGSGNDTIDVSAGTLGTNLKVDGGAGTDTIAFAGVANGAVVTTGTYTNFERLQVNAVTSYANNDAATVDASTVAGGQYVILRGYSENSTDAASLSVNNLASGATVAVQGNVANADATTGVVTLNLNLSAAGKAAATPGLDLVLGTATTTGITVEAGVVDASVKELSISSLGASGTNTAALQNDAVQTLTITGARDLTLAFDDTTTANNSRLTSVDLTEASGTVQLDVDGDDRAASNTGTKFLMGDGIASITLDLSDGKADTIVYTAASQSTALKTDSFTNFVVANDLIDISAIAQGTFSWLGATAFSANAGNTQARYSGTSTLQIDLDGDATADMVITLAGGIADDLTGGNFLV